MVIELDGAVACVTGAGRGIGKATAAELAGRGARVLIGDIDTEVAAQAADELGDRVSATHLDVTDSSSFAAFIALAEEVGPVALLVNNAGIMRTGAFAEQDPEGQHRELAINLGGVITGMRLVLPDMLARDHGHIVNVASMAGKITTPGASVYAASKFGVVALSRAVRTEIAGSAVTITTVLPAAVKTELTAGLGTSGMPLSAPASVARAVVDSCRHGRRQVAVPRWVAPIGEFVETLPEGLGETAKRLAGAQGRLTPANEDRRVYQSRT